MLRQFISLYIIVNVGGALIYLAGDSYPAGDKEEESIGQYLAAALGLRFISHNDLLSYMDGAPKSDHAITRIDKRVSVLKAVIGGFSSPVILIGRSSGARVASLCADESNVVAVVCLAYPFKHPHKAEEEIRYRHLKSLSTPTLVIQGIRDEYGGLVQMKKYKYSNAIRFFYVKAGHSMNLKGKTLELVRMRIRRLIFEALADLDISKYSV
jgi:predicted alpha/beta-hydrolase family hydrolase